MYIKSLRIKQTGDEQAKIEAEIANEDQVSAEPHLLILYFHDEENRIRDRINIRFKPVKPGVNVSVGTTFRLKNESFFTYTVSLEKTS